jgi:hypothetical protein
LANIEALRLLERLDRKGDVDYPADDDGRFLGGPEWWDLDPVDSDGVKERWRLNWAADRLR